MMDANDDLEDADFGRFMDNTNLYDILGTHHSVHSPPTYIRGTRTIDYILGTKNVVRATQNCGMNPFNDTIVTDHRGLWVDIDIPELLNGSIPPQQLTCRQPLKTNQVEKMRKIRKKAATLFKTKDIESRLTDLLRDCEKMAKIDLSGKLNQIDNDMDDIMLHSVPDNIPSHPYWWSPEIHQAHQCLLYWKIKRSETCLGINMKTQLEVITTNLDESFDIFQGDENRAISAQIRQAVANRKKLQ